MDILHIITVFVLLYGVFSEDEWNKQLQDISSENEKDEYLDNIKSTIDFRGKIRKHFGTVANLQDSEYGSVCSPVAALLPLGKLALGAKDSALKELFKAIGIFIESGNIDYTFKRSTSQSDYQAVKRHLSQIIAELRNVTRPILDVASRLYVSESRTVLESFDNQANSIFTSSIQKVNFHQPTAVAKEINDWVSSQTHEAISDIISTDDLSHKSSIVIINAIYYTGTWNTSFGQPLPAKVQTLRGEKELLTMQSNTWYKYAHNEILDAQLVEIPYAEPNVSLLLIVPKKPHGLKNLTMVLDENPNLLAQAIDKMTEQYIFLTMPTFRIESHWNLKTLYEEVGLKSIFTHDKSGLTGIVHGEGLHVSAAIQKAIIDVHDKGKHFHLFSILDRMDKPIIVTADHPFLFYIRLRSQQLLVGKCC